MSTGDAMSAFARAVWGDRTCSCGASLHAYYDGAHERVVIQHGDNPEAVRFERYLADTWTDEFDAWLDAVHVHEGRQ